jgi:hypothetical protein
MKFKRPSPAMAVACVALFVALGGTSVAAVNYARNAGKVDGYDAVKSSRSLKKAAGNLVAAYPGGSLKGQIANRHLAETPLARPFAQYLSVADNAAGAPVRLADTGSVGTLTATCTDQAAKAGVEDPVTTISFVDDSGQAINLSKRIGVNPAEVSGLQNGTVSSVVIRGSNTFEFDANLFGAVTHVTGVVRQDGSGTADAHCLVYGTSQQTGAR